MGKGDDYGSNKEEKVLFLENKTDDISCSLVVYPVDSNNGVDEQDRKEVRERSWVR